LSGRVALVTGASSGLGMRFAEVLAENGAAVALVARRTDRLAAVKARIEAAGGRAIAVGADVLDPAAMAQAFDEAEKAFGTVTVLINNAGVAHSGRAIELSAAEWRRVLSTDLDAVFFWAQEAARRMIASVASVKMETSTARFYCWRPMPAAISPARPMSWTAARWWRCGVRPLLNGQRRKRMDFTLTPVTEDIRQRTRAFVEDHVLPLEAQRDTYDEHENIREDVLASVRQEAKAAGLWAPQSPKEFGGMALPIAAWAVMYEEAARSIFGPLAFNCMAPDDGNMNLLARAGTPAQKETWLRPIVDGRVRSSFAMTEPAPGGGSDPGMIRTRAEKKGDKWVIRGRKWFITGADGAAHFILIARTSDDSRRGLTAFLYHRDQPGWRILRRIPIMGPEEHGGHCELEFDGLEVSDENVLMQVGDGLKITQIRLGPARLTHCMRWLGFAKRCLEIAQDYVDRREGFGIKLADRESVQIKLGEVAHQISIGRLLTMHAAWKLDQGERARKEVSMAKIHVADTLHNAADVAIQLNGARGYSKDTILEWIYRYARAARLVDGASEVHKMVLARFMREEGRDFWSWSAGNRV
jgi:acyl-CoA dehydrogenase